MAVYGSHDRPSDQELIVSFLRPRIAGDDPAADFIRDADVYSADPAALTGRYPPAPSSNGEEIWYFFCALRTKNRRCLRKDRTVGSGKGRWHQEKAAIPVLDEDGHRVGHRRNLSFKNKNGARLGWLMVEFGVDQEEDASPAMVVCKVYRSPRAPRAETSAMALSGRKRRAGAQHPEPRTRARRRHSPPTEAAASRTESAGALEEEKEGDDSDESAILLSKALMAGEPDMLQCAETGDSWTDHRSMLELLLADEGSLSEISPVESYECSIPVSTLEPDPSLPWSPSWASASYCVEWTPILPPCSIF